jgi:putative isomerase
MSPYTNDTFEKYSELIIDYARKNYDKMFRQAGGYLKYKFIVPGSTYSNVLWDWDSWLTNIALRELDDIDDISEYERGCILNFLEYVGEDGRMPIFITPERLISEFETEEDMNTHKPCIAQHALFVCENCGDFGWLRDKFPKLEKFMGFYDNNCKHESGLYFWLDDFAIGVDNDPCTFYRPKKSSGSIYLNCLIYMEKLALAKLAKGLGYEEKCKIYENDAEALKNAIQENCWDERDGFYYSVDFNLLPVDKTKVLHEGAPRHWNCLIQRIDVWSGFMAMWAGIATKEQADRMVKEHYLNERTFNAPYGVRTLSKLEKMYSLAKTGNPSCWLGPIWGISNYMTFRGLVNYGYVNEAKNLAQKTITLLGKDIEQNGVMHEYYHPDTGEGINNPGFQNWNYLSINMINRVKTL